MVELDYVYRTCPSGRKYNGEPLYWYIRIIQDTDGKYTFLIEEATDYHVKAGDHWDRFKLPEYWKEMTGYYPNNLRFTVLEEAEDFASEIAKRFNFVKVSI